MSDQPGSDLPGALEAITRDVAASNPQLYRHLALYLQVLRDVLPHRLEQTVFHLVTRVHAPRYLALEPSVRQHLRQRLALHLRRCGSLLTVEQLAALAAQMARESDRRRRLAQRRLLERLTEGAAELADGAPPPVPQGSVHLERSLPLAGDPPRWGAPAAGGQAPRSEPGLALPFAFPFSISFADGGDALQEPPETEGPSGDAGGGPEGAEEPIHDHPGPDSLGEADEAPELDFDGGDPGPWERGSLPTDPVELLRWLDGMDHALQRRLRNLSHAVNVELLRAGVSPTLLPVSLLDAALHGRVDSAPAPPHLLRLPLPFPLPGLPPGLPATAVLLRSADLELEEPRLRTCRRRLQQHRQELRRMAGRFRRLQRRLAIHQAERLWLQDLPPPSPPAD
ncbi:hypothetical protein NZK32_16720 [Cyanobium sp. FGCU-52]|nr:hypothetical protein [Cyanobium sp. FGCU52]